MIGNCKILTLLGPIESIKASYSNNQEAVTAVKFYRASASKTYGTLLSKHAEWQFDPTN